MEQMSLFRAVLAAYERNPDAEKSNDALYAEVMRSAVLPAGHWNERVPVGKSEQPRNLARRAVRWHQQTLKRMGLIERVPHKRGTWRATEQVKKELTPAPPRTFLVSFSTDLGVALWGACSSVFPRVDEPIHLCLTSPPYCLAKPRAYGNPSEQDYVDFICESLEPIIRNLVPGGSICLNISNDIFQKGLPARSMYRERLVLALHDRLGLHMMDQLIWENRSKAPGPFQWASKNRFQLNTAWEPVYWFTNDPSRVRSDNRRVLKPHSERHQRLIDQGGEKRNAVFGDGANRIRPGSFSNATPGTIPKNVLSFGHRCAKQSPARNALRGAGLPVHGAAMPYGLAEFLVRFLTEPDDLVVDPFAGVCTTPDASERNGRRWLASELMFEYLWGGSHRFEHAKGFTRDAGIN